jgi:hypothetical protein
VGGGQWQCHGQRGRWESNAHDDYLNSSDHEEHFGQRQTDQQEQQQPPQSLTSLRLLVVSQPIQYHRHATDRTASEDEHHGPGAYQILTADNGQFEPLPTPPSNTPGALRQIPRTPLNPIPSAQNSSASMQSIWYSTTRPISPVSVYSDPYECRRSAGLS